MNTVYLSLGSNLGDRHSNLDRALELLGQNVGEVVAVSDFIETQPWGFESDNAFLNAAAKVETGLTAMQVLDATQDIERQLGRTQKTCQGNYCDRSIDIDLLLYFGADGQMQRIESEQLTLPHKLMGQRDFVMVPLRQIAPELNLVLTSHN